MLVLVYCLATFDYDRKKLALNEAIFPPERFKRLARVIAVPVDIANVFNSLNSLRILSGTSFFTRMGTNFSLCFQFATLTTRRSKLRQVNRALYPFRHPVALVFVLLPVAIIVYVSQSIGTSEAACKPYPECVVHTFRWVDYCEGDETQCPCITLINGVSAPKTYAEWQQPENVMDKVTHIALSGDLQTVQLANRLLLTLPVELRRCRNLRHL